MPIELHTATVKSCEDIADAIAAAPPIDCTAPLTPEAKLLCFEQATYCSTTKSKTWTCDTTNNTCVYNTACVVAAGMDAPTGCPSHSRVRLLTALTCNAESKTCVGPTPVAGCTTDAKCEGKQVFDSAVADVCAPGECVCYAGNKQCYRACARDLDCGTGQTCDTKKSHLCQGSETCETDAQCAFRTGNLASRCNAGKCALSCATDRDCSGTGLNGPYTGMVCGSDNFCVSVASDCAEAGTLCPAAVGALKRFCVSTPTAPGVVISSSITD